MANQVVRQVFEVNQPGKLSQTLGGVQVTCSADYLLHTIANNTDSGGRTGYVAIGPVSDSGVMLEGFTFMVPSLNAEDVSLGCTAAKGGELLVVRGTIQDHPEGQVIVVKLMVITEPGATVSLKYEPRPWIPVPVPPIHPPLPPRAIGPPARSAKRDAHNRSFGSSPLIMVKNSADRQAVRVSAIATGPLIIQ